METFQVGPCEVYFFDSSAIVKRYVQESGTAWVQGLVHPGAGHRIYIARITGVEVCAAIIRRRRMGTLPPPAAANSVARLRLDLSQVYRVVEISVSLLTAAMRLAEVHELRAYDAVQLAAALEMNGRWLAAGPAGITLASADQDLNAAATAEGLTVENPNLHP